MTTFEIASIALQSLVVVGLDRELIARARRTANGEVYDRMSISAAHPTMPLPAYARVTNVTNSRSIIVRVNDRGPYKGGRVADLSRAAAERIGMVDAGVIEARLQVLALPRAAEDS